MFSSATNRVWASTQIGYTSSNVGTNTCGGGFCGSCVDPSNSGQTCGTGLSLLSPLTGQLVSITVFTGSVVATQVMISTFSGTTPASTTENCNTSGNAHCQSTNGGQTYVLQDTETLSGLSAQTYFAIGLSNPVTVSAGQWVAVTFVSSSCSGTLGSGCNINIFCGTGCGDGGAQNGLVQSTCIKFGSSSPTVGNSFTTATPGTCPIDTVVSGFFQVSSSLGQITQCYGNCGTPAVTLTNSNATKNVAFNQSLTMFYEFQSNLNGFLLNMTTSLATTAGSGQNIFLDIYTIDSCPANNQPFSPSCPGNLKLQSNYAGQTVKQRLFLKANANVPVSSGQWIGIAVSAVLTGLQLNSTNLACASNFACSQGMFYTNGLAPSSISSSALCTQPGPCSVSNINNVGLWAWISGSQTGAVPTPGTANCTNNFAQLDCMLPAMVNGLCTIVTVSCQTSSALLWIIILSFVSFMLLTVGFASAHVTKFVAAGDVFMFLFLGWFFIFAGFGLLASFVIIFFLFIGAVAFGKTARNYF